MRYLISILIGCTLLLLFLMRFESQVIMLPKGAQHNTIGELPLVEMLDDGDFYDIDGSEYGYSDCIKNGFRYYCGKNYPGCYKSVEEICQQEHRDELFSGCVSGASGQCTDDECVKKVEEACRKSGSGYPDCGDLPSGIYFTCNAMPIGFE